jgi:hypothetical protein
MLLHIMGPPLAMFAGLVGIVILDEALFRIHERRHRRGAEVTDFEPSEEFEMPPAMGIDYQPDPGDGQARP